MSFFMPAIIFPVNFLFKAIEKIPIFGGLVNCDCEDCNEALKELGSTLIVALSPVYLGAFVLICMDKENRGYWTILADSL